MAHLSQTEVCLRLFGDTLKPQDVTRQLGKAPSKSETKGETLIGRKTGQTRTARTGGWRLSAASRSPGDLDAQISELLDGLTQDLKIWKDLTDRYQADIFCGLFLKEENEGISLSPATLQKLAERNLLIDFDIYSDADGE